MVAEKTGTVFIIALLISIATGSVNAQENREMLPLSKEAEKSMIALGKLWGFLKYHHPESNIINLTVERDDKIMNVQTKCYDNQLLHANYVKANPPKEGYQIMDKNIGYVLPSRCREEDRQNGIKKVLDGTQGLIIDFRCYLDDYISFHFLEYLNHRCGNCK